MIKYFHELTEKEFKKKIVGKLTNAECDRDYPQPTWCNYPEATMGMMGCWSLISFMVTGEDYCKDCDCYSSPEVKE